MDATSDRAEKLTFDNKRRILNKKSRDLMKMIDITADLMYLLVQHRVLDHSLAEDIQALPEPSRQKSELINHLYNCSVGQFESFCVVLCELNRSDIVTDVFKLHAEQFIKNTHIKGIIPVGVLIVVGILPVFILLYYQKIFMLLNWTQSTKTTEDMNSLPRTFIDKDGDAHFICSIGLSSWAEVVTSDSITGLTLTVKAQTVNDAQKALLQYMKLPETPQSLKHIKLLDLLIELKSTVDSGYSRWELSSNEEFSHEKWNELCGTIKLLREVYKGYFRPHVYLGQFTPLKGLLQSHWVTQGKGNRIQHGWIDLNDLHKMLSSGQLNDVQLWWTTVIVHNRDNQEMARKMMEDMRFRYKTVSNQRPPTFVNEYWELLEKQ